MRQLRWIQALVIVSLALMVPSLKANNIPPGGSAAPDVFALGDSFSGGRTILGTTGTLTGSAGTFVVEFYEQVELDPTNLLCPGCEDLIFQFFNASSTKSETIVGALYGGFSGYNTDVGYDGLSVGSSLACGPDDNGFCNDGKANTIPTTVNRSADGNVVGLNFELVPSGATNPGIQPGEASVDLVIEVNSTTIVDPTVSLFDNNGNTVSFTVFGPPPISPSVPEPSSLLLLCAGLLGLVALSATRGKTIA